MKTNFSKVALLSSFITFASSGVMLLINIILGDELSTDNYGKYNIIRNLIILIPFAVFLGGVNSLIRMHKKINILNHNWPKSFNEAIDRAIIIIIPLFVILYIFTNFFIIQCYMIALSCLLLGRVSLTNSILRINQEYAKAAAIINLWRYFFIILLLIYIASDCYLHINFLILLMLFSCLLSYFFSIIFEKKIKFKTVAIKYTQIVREGFLFFLFGLSNIFLAQLDKLLIWASLGDDIVGVYSAISLLPITIFNISASSLGVVAMPYFITNNKGQAYRRKILFFCYIIIPISLYFLLYFFGIQAIQVFWGDKFDSGYHFYYYCNLLGLLQYFQVLSYYFLGAFENNKTIKKITTLNYTIIMLMFPLYLALTFKYGILGAIISFILVWSSRLLVSLYYLFFKKTKAIEL